jgi:hypothetical protein
VSIITQALNTEQKRIVDALRSEMDSNVGNQMPILTELLKQYEQCGEELRKIGVK